MFITGKVINTEINNFFLQISVDETDGVYVDPDITDSVGYQQPVMPPMPGGLSPEQVHSKFQ